MLSPSKRQARPEGTLEFVVEKQQIWIGFGATSWGYYHFPYSIAKYPKNPYKSMVRLPSDPLKTGFQDGADGLFLQY